MSRGEFYVEGWDVKMVAKWRDVFNAGQYGRTITGYKSVLGPDYTEAQVRELLAEAESVDFMTFHDDAMLQLRNPRCSCGEPAAEPGGLCPDCDDPAYDAYDDECGSE